MATAEKTLEMLLGYIERGFVVTSGEGVYMEQVGRLKADGYNHIVYIHPKQMRAELAEDK